MIDLRSTSKTLILVIPEFKLIDNETQKELDKEYWSYFCREY